MKYVFTGLLLINLASIAVSQTTPPLSTADKIALQTCEASKQEAQKRYQDASQQELAILREFQSSHPGFHLNDSTFAVEPDQKATSAAKSGPIPVAPPAPKKEVK